jgi:hypothetical protein
MTRQELYMMAIKQIREYRAVLITGFSCLTDDKEVKKRIGEAKNAVMCTVQKTDRFSYYSFSDLPRRAYEIVSKKEEGDADYILALNRYLERCAESFKEELCKMFDAREAPWNAGTEMVKFRKLSEEYRALFEEHIHSRENVDVELRSIVQRMIAIYIHPRMNERSLLRCILMDAVAKPTSNEEETNGVDAALSREGFALLEKLQKALVRKLKEQSKNRGRR